MKCSCSCKELGVLTLNRVAQRTCAICNDEMMLYRIKNQNLDKNCKAIELCQNPWTGTQHLKLTDQLYASKGRSWVFLFVLEVSWLFFTTEITFQKWGVGGKMQRKHQLSVFSTYLAPVPLTHTERESNRGKREVKKRRALNSSWLTTHGQRRLKNVKMQSESTAFMKQRGGKKNN